MEKDDRKTCDECKAIEERGAKMCCFTDCMLKAGNLLNKTGLIDFEAAKNALVDKVENDAKWIAAIKETVTTCIADGKLSL